MARLVAVMDRLRSPGGCPWDAAQTHASLARYLLEETHEVLEALDTGDRVLLREELGDLLLQVVFHSRIAAEDPAEGFALADVAGDVADKLVRRHPHVFAGQQADGEQADGKQADGGDLLASWETRKRAEKGRRGLLEGVPATIPALLAATKVLDRLAAADRPVPTPQPGSDPDRDAVGAELMAAVARARVAGVEPEQALRDHVRRLTAAVDGDATARPA